MQASDFLNGDKVQHTISLGLPFFVRGSVIKGVVIGVNTEINQVAVSITEIQGASSYKVGEIRHYFADSLVKLE